MSLPHSSVATINSIEFINLQPLDINPMMSKCQIKVFYVGENRNGSYIKKEVAKEMAKTLRGAPIVGYYKDDKQDFSDHGEKVTFEGGEVVFECMTKPYGFVSPDAEVWFEKFIEQDDFGNEVEREYLVTTGYLWTGQYEEVKSVLEEGKPQSMELDDNSLDGHWATNPDTRMEFFIIEDATISKLCILGDDVEPCFEGASITAEETKTRFTLDKDFKTTLFSMMKELEVALKGENTVEDFNKAVASTEEVVEETVTTPVEEEFVATEKEVTNEDASANSDFAEKKDEEDDADDASDDSETADDADSEDESKDEDEDDKKENPVKNSLHTDEEYDALKTEFDELTSKFAALEEENKALVEFKVSIEDKQKDELIAKFYMLSEADKKDVIENKRNYSLEDIESKLAVICYRKKVNFDSESSSNLEDNTTEEKQVLTYNVNTSSNSSLPEWLKAAMETEESQRIIK